MNYKIEAVQEKVFRIRTGNSSSALNRYGFIQEADAAPAILHDFKLNSILPNLAIDDSHTVSYAPDVGEDWIGFGDQTRDRMFHRSHRIDCWVRNVKSYIPVPFFISTKGYAVLVNSTHRVEFDMAAAQADKVSWHDHSGKVDFYLFTGGSFMENIRLYTNLTGKPKLPPEWAFGLWYICREQANDYEVVNDALNFRREGIPCDVIGLEPGWMEDKDDLLSPDKKWHPQRFPIPEWCPNGPHNFINAVKRMGFHFELWERNEYDLSYEEERNSGSKIDDATVKPAGNFKEGAEEDTHFTWPRFADKITRKEESWFEHHKKFIDQGVDFFKMDGSYQVCEHPDRVWGNGMLDREMHNLYPLLYARQMYDGFAGYAGRRPVTFTPAGWTGFQAYAGTWSGDTGGRLETLGGMLNTAIMSHNWQTNDMEVMQSEGIHFGYLLPWSQINSWTYFRMPWVQGEKLLGMHQFYSRLRARLIPYIYSWARQTAEQGIPLLLRPLQLEFEHDVNCRGVMHEYLLGRDLLVTIYKKEIYLPEGYWKDFWNGKVYEGGRTYRIDWPENRGGGLFLRAGAIIPFAPVMQYRRERDIDEINLYLFPCDKKSTFEMYEDDGFSFDYRKGKFAVTPISCRNDGNSILIEIAAPCGDFIPAENRKWNITVAIPFSNPVLVLKDGIEVSGWDWNREQGELKVENLQAPSSLMIKLNANF